MWNIEGHSPEFYLTVNGIRCVGDSGRVNIIELCYAGNNKDEIWFKLKNETNGKRLRRSLVDRSNEKLAATTSNAEFLQQLEEIGLSVAKRTRKNKNKRSAAGVDLVDDSNVVTAADPASIPQDLTILREKSAGHFTLDVEQLERPADSAIIRAVDNGWVTQIKDEIRRKPAPPVTRIPVVYTKEISAEDFNIEMTKGDKFVTLGGNHLLTAIKDILKEEEENQHYECLRKIDVEVFCQLTNIEAMFIQSWHNTRCQQKPMDFKAKVLLARKVFDMGHDTWKEEVVTAIGELDGKNYRIEGLSTILSVAGYSNENWSLVDRMLEETGQETMPQNIFKQLQNFPDGERTPYLSRAIGSNGLKVARQIIADKRRAHMKQLACAILHAASWNEIEEQYMLADNMLVYTGDLTTPEGRRRFGGHVSQLAANAVDDMVINITATIKGVDQEIPFGILEKCKTKIKKALKNKTSEE